MNLPQVDGPGHVGVRDQHCSLATSHKEDAYVPNGRVKKPSVSMFVAGSHSANCMFPAL